MLQRIRNYLIIAILIGIFYFLLSNHILFNGFTDYRFLPKSELTLKDTFVSLKSNDPETLLRNEALRASGIDELLIEMGLLTRSKANDLLRRIDRD